MEQPVTGTMHATMKKVDGWMNVTMRVKRICDVCRDDASSMDRAEGMLQVKRCAMARRGGDERCCCYASVMTAPPLCFSGCASCCIECQDVSAMMEC